MQWEYTVNVQSAKHRMKLLYNNKTKKFLVNNLPNLVVGMCNHNRHEVNWEALTTPQPTSLPVYPEIMMNNFLQCLYVDGSSQTDSTKALK